jgi:tartrate-resistant acid phosphatase type 5
MNFRFHLSIFCCVGCFLLNSAVAQETPLTLAVIGDFGSAHSGNTAKDQKRALAAEKSVADLVKGWNPAFIITVGDNNYHYGRQDTIDDAIGQFYSAYVGKYHGKYQPAGVEGRFFPTLGNHDWGDDHKPINCQAYLDYFDLPGNERYYEIDKDVVHLFALDSDGSEKDGMTAGSTQALWLKAALEHSTAPWKIVYFHEAPYSSGMQHGSNEKMRWPFRKWGASVVLSGHEHNYEHLIEDGLHFFVNGLGGDFIYEDLPKKKNGKLDTVKSTPGSQFQYSAKHGAMKIQATSKELILHFLTVDGEEPEPATLLKK